MRGPYVINKMLNIMSKWIAHTLSHEALATADTETAAVVEGVIPMLPGIDTAAGLATCMGIRGLYRKFLRLFRDGRADFAEQFRKPWHHRNVITPE